MNVWWSYCWPVMALGLLVGTISGSIAFRRKNRYPLLAIAAAIVIAGAALWHGPLGAADRFTRQVERNARQALDYYEMARVAEHLHRGPLTRELLLSGTADDFQRSELVRLMSQLPGVSAVSWSQSESGLPLIGEAALYGIGGFLFGLLLAYLVELRRRYNAQWKW
jgi:ABC-type branched-subunit amino acid transport system permease subunit